MQPYYNQLFATGKNLFSPGAPIVIASGALLQDTQTGQLFAQIIMENVHPVPVISMKLEITGLDPADRPLTGAMEHYIMDINAPRGVQFGGTSLFPIPHPAVRAFSFRILEIIFADKTIWVGEDCLWAPLPASRTLEDTLGDAELARQYRLEYGQNSMFAPVMLEELYLCSCGAPNRHQYACARCGASPSALSDTLIEHLREKADARLEEETKRAEEARQLAMEQQRIYEEEQARKAVEKQQKKEEQAVKWAKTKKKIVRTVIISAIVLVLVCALAAAAVLWVIPEINYQAALTAIERKDYEEAYRLFTVLEDYRDTEDQLDRFLVKTTMSQTTYTYSDGADKYSSDDYYDEYSPHSYNKTEEDSYGSRTEYKFDRNGQTTWSKQTSLGYENGRFVEEGEPEIDEEWYVITYNNAGNPTERITPYNSRYTYEYNSAGKLAKKNYFYDDELSGVYTYSYGSNGKVSKELYTAETYTTTTTYEYNGDGKLIRQVSESVYPDDSDRNSKSVTTCSYNAAGKLTESKTTYTNQSLDTRRTSVYTYTYNWRNDLVEYEYRYNTDSYYHSQTYEITYNALGHMSTVEGVYKYTDKDDDESYSEKESAEITCRLDGTMESVELKVRYSGDTDSEDYESYIEYDGSENVTSKKVFYDDGRVIHYKYERTYFYFPEGMLLPSEY